MTPTDIATTLPDLPPSAFDQLIALGWQINENQYKAVHLAARFDDERQWFYEGFKSAALAISRELHIHNVTAREWIRVGHALRYLPLVDAAFAANEISYTKVRSLTRWAGEDNEQQLLDLAYEYSASRLTTAIARVLDHNSPDSDEERDRWQHDARSFSSYTDGDGMVVIRVVLPPANAKPLVAAVDKLVKQIASMPAENDQESGDADNGNVANSVAEAERASAEASEERRVADRPSSNTQSDLHASAEAPSASRPSQLVATTLRELRQRWQPAPDDDWYNPAPWQQRADAFVAMFLGLNIDLTTEVVIHIRGEGNTFDDGTPLTTNAITRQLDQSYIRLLLHDAKGRPIDATNRRRHPTTRQARLVDEQHRHQCDDCGMTYLLEYDHNPPFEETGHTVTSELDLRCAPCHRARHRIEHELAA